jgi:hypothetical protein
LGITFAGIFILLLNVTPKAFVPVKIMGAILSDASPARNFF